MTTAWSDAAYDFNQRPSRPARARYVPPHYRNDDVSAFNNASEPAQSGYATLNRFESRRQGRNGGSTDGGRGRSGGRGRGGGSGGTSRGRRFSRPEDVSGSSPYVNGDGFDIAEKFDDLQLTEEDGNGGGINFDAYEDIPVEASGSDIPPPVNTFDEIDLDQHLNENIKRCNYVKPTPIQRHAIPIAVAGRDLMACAQTGSGKTAAFCFPIISGIMKDRYRLQTAHGSRTAYPYALILSPTRELSCQIHDEAKKFAYQTGVKIAVAYGGASISQQLRNLERGADILVATPGRLVDMIERERVSLTRIKYLALDEADRMLDMGFEPQIRKIVQQMDMPAPGVRQTMLFSATFPHDIQRLASDFLSNYIFLTVGRVGSSTELIAQKVELVQDVDKRNFLTDILYRQRENGARGKQALTLVFVETKRGADALENWLSRKGFPAIAIHGDKVQMERERALRSFKSGATPILVATDVASRGLDIPHVAHVINFDLPKDIDDYVHRIGRTGRAGKSGLATAFFSDKNMPLAKSLVILMKEANQEVPTWLSQYAENSSSSGSSSRAHRYGSSKYGGHDFRRAAEPEVQNYNYFTGYGNADQCVDASYTDASYDFTNSCSDSFYSIQQPVPAGGYYYADPSVGSYGVGDAQVGQYGYTSVVATGWD